MHFKICRARMYYAKNKQVLCMIFVNLSFLSFCTQKDQFTMLLILFGFSLFANNNQMNKQTTKNNLETSFLPLNTSQVYLLNYASNSFHIFPILFHFYVMKLQFFCTSQNFPGLKIFFFKNELIFQKKPSNLEPKLLNLTNNCS